MSKSNHKFRKFVITLAAIFGSVAVCGCQATATDSSTAELEYLQMPMYEGQNLPFSAAVRVDNMLYLSGVIGTDPGAATLSPMPGGVAAETRRAMEIIRDELETFGSSMDRVVKCTIFLADMNEWGAMNEVYVTFFDTPPARSALGANGLAIDARVEIECIAALN
ncbi:MAG: RidA family protein [Woeseiaceae bacterium]